eukprot:TRINITY_DN4864_c0_g1_i1.p1 TRINITY_DN4864_c0_g1~~TRINITY_DN4864_c0_g1_i1.p1  ORF type:complete len:195 (+),score=5.64 TRINITY_DN4864_c0_g1_i1:454-1038(+)
MSLTRVSAVHLRGTTPSNPPNRTSHAAPPRTVTAGYTVPRTRRTLATSAPAASSNRIMGSADQSTQIPRTIPTSASVYSRVNPQLPSALSERVTAARSVALVCQRTPRPIVPGFRMVTSLVVAAKAGEGERECGYWWVAGACAKSCSRGGLGANVMPGGLVLGIHGNRRAAFGCVCALLGAPSQRCCKNVLMAA